MSGRQAPSDTPHDGAVSELLDRLNLEQKIRLLTGATFWSTHAEPSIGLESMVLSDGPAGVRGTEYDERHPSVSLPSGSCLGATWDLDLAQRYGAALGSQALERGVHVVLGPTINLHRTPYGGRHFEALSEDPYLTGTVTAALVKGLQATGVGSCPKHYVGNDSETDRMTVDVAVDERTLHEVYLAPFDAAVKARAWMVMSAYNSVNGATMTESPLLDEPLKGEWGFDGVVLSDWTAVRSTSSAASGQDLVFPGPESPWTGGALLAAVQSGTVSEARIDDKVRRLLLLAGRVGALPALSGEPAPAGIPTTAEVRALAREAAIAGTVLLSNDGVLPLSRSSNVALIGHSALTARSQGGGSAVVVPEHEITPEAALREVFGEAMSVSLGALVHDDVRPFTADRMLGGVARCTFTDADGAVLFTEERATTHLAWFAPHVAASTHLRIEVDAVTDARGQIDLAVHLVGVASVSVLGEQVWSGELVGEGADLGGNHRVPGTVDLDVPPSAPGHIVPLVLEHVIPKGRGQLDEHLFLVLGERPRDEGDALVAEAVARAAAADVAIVVVGTNAHVESEGRDRADLRLPGRQDELVRAVIAVNPRTVVVVNSGAPVLMPWSGDAAAVLVGWFGGQEMGRALADMLVGTSEPGGRLPTTWPRAEEDLPVREVVPTAGRLRYAEGIHLGHRAWLHTEAEPAFWFGHGLGYTSWELGDPVVDRPVDESASIISVTVPVTNTGSRAGKQVVQVYLERRESVYDRPVRWLGAFAALEAAAGVTQLVTIDLPRRALEVRDAGAWVLESGTFTVRVGLSAKDLPGETTFTV